MYVKSISEISSCDFRRDVLGFFQDKLCLRVGKYMGSMLYFDIGDPVLFKSIRSGWLQKGEVALGVRDCFWTIDSKEKTILNSDVVCHENLDLLQNFVGASLKDLKVFRSSMALYFSEGFSIKCDLSNKYESEDNILEFSVYDRYVFSVSCEGRFYLETMVQPFVVKI